MNKRLVIRLLAAILLIEAACMVPSLLISLLHRDGDTLPLLITILGLCALCTPAFLLARPEEKNLRAREGFFVVGFAWVLLSVFGAVPFVLGGMLPNFIDAVFESVSGFTTTGATVLKDFAGAPRGLMFWRAFTHWIGGMGVLVLTLALIPKLTGRTAHLVRAESPGPTMSKIVPKMGQTAKLLYIIYFGLTITEFVILLFCGLTPYDAAIHAMSTAGTGGFSNYGESVGAFRSSAVDAVITLFMFMFGVNFALYYQVLIGQWRSMFRSEEFRWYAAEIILAVLGVTLYITPLYGRFLTALRYGSFQVGAFISTTGFTTADFNQWPQGAKAILLLLMLSGGCAGSTAGGMKVVRIALVYKMARREVLHTFQPRKVQAIRFEDRPVDAAVLQQISVFCGVYTALIFFGTLLICLEGRYTLETNFTSALSAVSNVGPVFSHFAPMSDMAGYGPIAKISMCLLMLAGRLELFPMLALFHPALWKKR